MAKGIEKLTVKERLMEVLGDGFPHSREQLLRCIDDEIGQVSTGTLRFHICKLREVLRPKGYDILTQFIKGKYYDRLVRLLASPYKE